MKKKPQIKERVLRSTYRLLKDQLKQVNEQNLKLQDDLQRKEQAHSETRKALTRYNEDLQRKDAEVRRLLEQEKRFDRLVDQFLSVAIVPFGATLQPGQSANLPDNLRKTGPGRV